MKKLIALLGLALGAFNKQNREDVYLVKAPRPMPRLMSAQSLAPAIDSKDYYQNFYSYVKTRNQRQKRKIKRARPF